jgi:hypothetical protein
MTKKKSKIAETKKRDKEHVSPLTAALTTTTTSGGKSRTPKKSQKRARKEAKDDLEERRLTSLLFGSGAAETEDLIQETTIETNSKSSALSKNEDVLFQIDRTGEEMEVKGDFQAFQKKVVVEDDFEDDNDDSSEGDSRKGDAPAWVDQDEQHLSVNIVDSSKRLRKLRNSRDEVAAKSLDGEEFERRLRTRYEQTTQATARTDWARFDQEPKKGAIRGDDDNENEASLLASTSAPLLATSRQRLPPNILNIMRCPDANQSDPNQAVVQAVHFHPGSDPDRPLLLTAGLDKTLRFFQVGAEKSQKIHGIHCR